MFFTNGVATNVPVTLTLAQTTAIVAQDDVNTYAGVISSNLVVNAGNTYLYEVSAGASQTAGEGFAVTVTGQDAYGNTVNDSSTAVTMSSSSASVSFGANPVTLTNGTFVVDASDTVAESFTITATDPNGTNGVSTSITVGAASLAQFEDYLRSALRKRLGWHQRDNADGAGQLWEHRDWLWGYGELRRDGWDNGDIGGFHVRGIERGEVTPTVAGSSKTFTVSGSGATGTATFNVNPGTVSAAN